MAHPNVGICLQAYLYRTKDDLANLLPLRPSIRLVKGAYNEPPEIAFPHKHDVDESYFVLGRQMLRAKKENRCVRAAFGTHDVALIRRLADCASAEDFAKRDFEVQMLYGIQRAEQERLANEGCTSIVLVAYGRSEERRVGKGGGCGGGRREERMDRGRRGCAAQ